MRLPKTKIMNVTERIEELEEHRRLLIMDLKGLEIMEKKIGKTPHQQEMINKFLEQLYESGARIKRVKGRIITSFKPSKEEEKQKITDMNDRLKKEFDELLLLGRSLSEKEFDEKIDEFLSNKTEAEKEFFSDYFVTVCSQKMNEYKDVSEEISMLKQLEGIEEYVNISKIAKSYFGKSRSWIHQRLHGHSVHGKPAKFTPAEKATLSQALLSLSDNLKAVAYKIA